MKNLVNNLCCRKSLLLTLTLLCGTNQVYADKAPRLAVFSLSALMSQQPASKKAPPLFSMGLFSLAGGGVLIHLGDTAQSVGTTGLGALLAVGGVYFITTKVLRAIEASNTVVDGDEIVVYASDDDYQLGHIIDTEESSYPSSITVVSADGKQDTIAAQQIKLVIDLSDLSDHYFNTLKEPEILEVKQHILNYLRNEASDVFLNNAKIAFEHEGKNYLETFSGIKSTDDGVELIIKDDSRGRVVINIDSEGTPVLDGDLRGDLKQAVILWP